MIFAPHAPSLLGLIIAILGGISWMAILVGIVLLIIWAVRAMPRTTFMGSAPASVESPMDILARRFAMGEISAEEYIRSREMLSGGPSADQPKPPA
ncbi:MAG TPA: SHOCT domain-containing protein [Candidatus Dormibacteraeota bacterium]